MSDTQRLRSAAAAALAQRFPARWLEEHAVLPLELNGEAARVAADGPVPPHVQDTLERVLQATVTWEPASAGDIRAAVLAAPRTATEGVGELSTLSGDAVESLDDLRALASREPVVQVVNAILKLVRSARPTDATADIGKHLAWGPGPRAGQALMLAVRARALLQGRLAPSLDDVAALAEPVLKHRMALSFGARADGIRLPDLIATLVSRLA